MGFTKCKSHTALYSNGGNNYETTANDQALHSSGRTKWLCGLAECLKISVVTQGETLDKVVKNLQEAIALHLEGEDLAEFGLVAYPSVLVTFELQPSYA